MTCLRLASPPFFFFAFFFISAMSYEKSENAGMLYAQTPVASQIAQAQTSKQETQGVSEEELFRFELLYYDYLRSGKASVLTKQVQIYYQRQQKKELAGFILSLEEKSNTKAQTIVINYLARLGDYNLLYKLYFQKDSQNVKRASAFIKKYPTYYYHALLLRNENTKLLTVLAQALWQAPKNTSLELTYLRRLALKNKDAKKKRALLLALDNLVLQAKTDKLKALEKTDAYDYALISQYFKKSLQEQIYFTLGQYAQLAALLHKQPSPQQASTLVKNKIFQSLKPARLQLQRNFLNKMYASGNYDSFLKLSEQFSKTIKVNKNTVQRAAIHSKGKQLQQKYANISIELKAKLQLYENNYSAVLQTLACQDKVLQSQLDAHAQRQQSEKKPITAHEQRRYVLGKNALKLCAIAFAAHSFFAEYSDLLAAMQAADRKNFQWVLFFFTQHGQPQELEKQLDMLAQQSLQKESRLALEIDFLDLLSSKKQSLVFVELFRRVLSKDKNLLLFAEENKEKLGQKAFEFAVSEYARHAMDLGEYEITAKLRRQYLATFQFETYKERLLFYEGITQLFVDKDKGKNLLLTLLTIYPNSVYRFEIERALNYLLL